MRFSFLVALATIASVGPGIAGEGGLRRVPGDFAPAVSTQYTRPDGGRRYEYPANTGNIVRAEDRTAYDRPADDPATKSSRPLPPAVSTNPANKPPERVGR